MKKLFQLVGYITIDGIDGAIRKLDGVEKKARKAIRPIQRFGQQTAQIGKTFTTSFTVPLALAGAAVVKFGADFEKSMTNSLAIMGKGADQMRDKMENTARDVAKTSTYSATQAAEAYYFLASAGLDAAQSMAALPKVAQFAQAGNFDLALATDLLTDAQSALGLSSDNTAEAMENMVHVSDVLVKANTIANASVQQFSEALTNKAGAALRLLGKDVEEGAAVLAVFADQGKKGSDAGTALDIVLRDLQKASITNRKAFEEANITVYDQSGEMRNLGDIIADVEGRFSDMSDEQKRAELMALGFTDKSVAATAALIGTSDAIKNYEKDLRSASGITDEVARKQLQSFWAQLEIVKSKLIDVAIELSESLLPILSEAVIPVVEKMVSKLTKLAKWFTSLPTSVQKTVIGLAAFAAVAGPALIIIGKLVASVTMVTTALKLAKLAMVAFNATMVANPFGLVVLGIAAVTGAIIGLRAEYKRLQEAHKEWSIMTTDQAARKAFIDGVSQVIEKIKAQSDTLKTEADVEAALGEEIAELTKKAREMGFVIEGNTAKKLEAINTIRMELQGVRDTTGALVKYTNDKKVDTEETVKNTNATKENTKAKEEWLQKLREQGKEGIELIEAQRIAEVNNAKEAGENAATIAAINRYYANEKQAFRDEEARKIVEEVAATKKAAEEKRTAEIDYITRIRIAYAQFTGDKLKAIELQRSAEIKAAEDSLTKEDEILEAKKAINAQYDKDRLKALEEMENEKDRIRHAGLEMQGALQSEEFEMVSSALNQIMALTQMSTNNKITKIDQETQKQKEAINASKMNEEEKAAAIEKLEKAQDKKKQALMIKQAKRDKAAAIFAATINAVQAVSKALTLGFPLGIIMAAVFAALGIAQVAMIAAQPLPQLAEGGYVPQTNGGRQVVVAEGNDSETILPMRKGTEQIASGILDKIGSRFAPEIPGAGAKSSSNRVSRESRLRPIQHIWQIGTLIANDDGIKELERRQLAFRVSEEQRKGND